MRHSRFFDAFLITLILALSACDDLLYNAQTNDNVTSDLAQMVSDELRDVTAGLGTLTEYCGSDNTNPAAEDAYSAALPGALSLLLNDPGVQDFDFETLREIFRQGAAYSDVQFYPGDTEMFVAAIKSFVCMASTERPENWDIYVMNRRGERWLVGKMGNSPSPQNIQWAGDRWLMVYILPQWGGQVTPRLWQVQQDGGGWKVTSDFSLAGIMTRWPTLVLDDSYRRIRLRIRTYNPNLPPCTLEPAQLEGAELFYYDVDTVLEWQGETYAVVDEAVTTINVGRGQTSADIIWTTLDLATLECINLGAQARLAQSIRNDLPIKPDASVPQADPCQPDFDASMVDDYNQAQIQVLAQLLAEPEAQSLNADDLAAAFNRVAEVRTFVKGDDNFLAAIPAWTPQCAPGRSSGGPLLLAVINRRGEIWPLQTLHSNQGWGAFIQPQWAEDRWLAVVNNDAATLCHYCYSIWEIRQEGDDWTFKSLLDLGTTMDGNSQWVTTPQLTLLDSYRHIALNLSPDYIEPPCTFTPSIQPELYMIWREIRREYQWNPEGYQQIAETDIETHVVINAIDELGRHTYRQLDDWQAYCIQPSS
jgi:hypothetical protein